jgi:hypothetical protein
MFLPKLGEAEGGLLPARMNRRQCPRVTVCLRGSETPATKHACALIPYHRQSFWVPVAQRGSSPAWCHHGKPWNTKTD